MASQGPHQTLHGVGPQMSGQEAIHALLARLSELSVRQHSLVVTFDHLRAVVEKVVERFSRFAFMMALQSGARNLLPAGVHSLLSGSGDGGGGGGGGKGRSGGGGGGGGGGGSFPGYDAALQDNFEYQIKKATLREEISHRSNLLSQIRRAKFSKGETLSQEEMGQLRSAPTEHLESQARTANQEAYGESDEDRLAKYRTYLEKRSAIYQEHLAKMPEQKALSNEEKLSEYKDYLEQRAAIYENHLVRQKAARMEMQKREQELTKELTKMIEEAGGERVSAAAIDNLAFRILGRLNRQMAKQALVEEAAEKEVSGSAEEEKKKKEKPAVVFRSSEAMAMPQKRMAFDTETYGPIDEEKGIIPNLIQASAAYSDVDETGKAQGKSKVYWHPMSQAVLALKEKLDKGEELSETDQILAHGMAGTVEALGTKTVGGLLKKWQEGLDAQGDADKALDDFLKFWEEAQAKGNTPGGHKAETFDRPVLQKALGSKAPAMGTTDEGDSALWDTIKVALYSKGGKGASLDNAIAQLPGGLEAVIAKMEELGFGGPDYANRVRDRETTHDAEIDSIITLAVSHLIRELVEQIVSEGKKEKEETAPPITETPPSTPADSPPPVPPTPPDEPPSSPSPGEEPEKKPEAEKKEEDSADKEESAAKNFWKSVTLFGKITEKSKKNLEKRMEDIKEQGLIPYLSEGMANIVKRVGSLVSNLGGQVMSAGNPLAYQTLMDSFTLLAGKISTLLLPTFLQLIGAVQGLADWIGSLSPEWKKFIQDLVYWGVVVGGSLLAFNFALKTILGTVALVNTALMLFRGGLLAGAAGGGVGGAGSAAGAAGAAGMGASAFSVAGLATIAGVAAVGGLIAYWVNDAASQIPEAEKKNQQIQQMSVEEEQEIEDDKEVQSVSGRMQKAAHMEQQLFESKDEKEIERYKRGLSILEQNRKDDAMGRKKKKEVIENEEHGGGGDGGGAGEEEYFTSAPTDEDPVSHLPESLRKLNDPAYIQKMAIQTGYGSDSGKWLDHYLNKDEEAGKYLRDTPGAGKDLLNFFDSHFATRAFRAKEKAESGEEKTPFQPIQQYLTPPRPQEKKEEQRTIEWLMEEPLRIAERLAEAPNEAVERIGEAPNEVANRIAERIGEAPLERLERIGEAPTPVPLEELANPVDILNRPLEEFMDPVRDPEAQGRDFWLDDETLTEEALRDQARNPLELLPEIPFPRAEPQAVPEDIFGDNVGGIDPGMRLDFNQNQPVDTTPFFREAERLQEQPKEEHPKQDFGDRSGLPAVEGPPMAIFEKPLEVPEGIVIDTDEVERPRIEADHLPDVPQFQPLQPPPFVPPVLPAAGNVPRQPMPQDIPPVVIPQPQPEPKAPDLEEPVELEKDQFTPDMRELNIDKRARELSAFTLRGMALEENTKYKEALERDKKARGGLFGAGASTLTEEDEKHRKKASVLLRLAAEAEDPSLVAKRKERQEKDKDKKKIQELSEKQKVNEEQKGLLLSLRAMAATPQYSDLDNAYKKVQLDVLGKDPALLAIEKEQRDNALEMIRLQAKGNETLLVMANAIGGLVKVEAVAGQ